MPPDAYLIPDLMLLTFIYEVRVVDYSFVSPDRVIRTLDFSLPGRAL